MGPDDESSHLRRMLLDIFYPAPPTRRQPRDNLTGADAGPASTRTKKRRAQGKKPDRSLKIRREYDNLRHEFDVYINGAAQF